MRPSFWPPLAAQAPRVNPDGSAHRSAVEDVEEGLEHAEASLRNLRGLWTRILSEAQILQKERGSRGLGSGFTDS